MIKLNIKYTVLLVFLLSSFCIEAAEVDSVSNKMIHRLGIDVATDYVFPIKDFFKGDNLKGEKISTRFSAHLKWAFKFAPNSYYGRNYRHTSQGIGLSYNTFFNNAEMGSPIGLYVFQNSRIAQLSRNLSLDYEWNFGASFGWKKYDAETNPKNDVVGSKVNAYINLGLMLNWKFAPQWNMTFGVGMTHFSNGNTSYPNYGVNTFGARIGVIHTLGNEKEQKFYAPADIFKPYFSYDLVLYGAWRKKGVGETLVPGSFGIVGMNFNPMYNFSKYFRAGASLDIQYDESANIGSHVVDANASADRIKFHRPPFKEQFGVGLSLRGEIVMPIFSINIGIGKNFICSGEDTNKFYQIFALKTHLTKRLFVHVGYMLYNFEDPNNLMLGVGYRFNGK